MTGGAGTGVGAAGCTGVVGTVGSRGEFRTFSRKVVKTGSTGIGATTGGAAGVSVRGTGSAAGGSMLIGAGAGPALAASRWVVRSSTVRSGMGGRGPPCAVTDEGVVECVFPVVKCIKVGTRLLIAGEEEVFCFSSSEVRWIV